MFAQNIVAKIGFYFAQKYLRSQIENGTLRTAKNMRKQGIPIEVTLLILCERGAV